MIPEKVFKEIVARAKNQWPDDKEMQRYCISEEKEGYNKLQSIDFGDLENLKDEFIKSALESFEHWTEIFDSVESELSAYREFLAFSADGVAHEVIEEWKAEAKEKYEDYYAGQLEFLENKSQKHASIIATRQQIDPIKSLLIELEQIVGNECYNGNIQNYGSWGELESEGRQFRYPVKFYSGSEERKRRTVSPDIPSEELITGYYAFGANELNIYRALFKVVSHLREKYDLKV
ncbi:hypothetical protein EHN06_08980 [Marinobacter sp. NP-4(2019)]|uniref:hypothetical protein n=1 Tax=Marinobacter sp. NP-4(2019) TaxID=2488665 RepID=UPI000FC3E75F|nr:hypothetical protein [Marinobacter sp. NP-4(2019)]AZT83661.1 hypothetical protein EHN06_08980 [Marinobacter sp. NP-4(2019)]